MLLSAYNLVAALRELYASVTVRVLAQGVGREIPATAPQGGLDRDDAGVDAVPILDDIGNARHLDLEAMHLPSRHLDPIAMPSPQRHLDLEAMHLPSRHPGQNGPAFCSRDLPVWLREVYILGDGIPVVHAKVIAPLDTYLHFKTELDNLGDQFLGEAFLYKIPHHRSPFEYWQIDNQWRRSSTFTVMQYRFYVQETFLT